MRPKRLATKSSLPPGPASGDTDAFGVASVRPAMSATATLKTVECTVSSYHFGLTSM